MSPDLDCEVENYPPVVTDSQNASTIVGGVGHRHIEIGFSLLTDSDRKSFNPFVIQAQALVSAVALNLEPSVLQEPQAIARLSSRRLIHDLPFRGPPTLPA